MIELDRSPLLHRGLLRSPAAHIVLASPWGRRMRVSRYLCVARRLATLSRRDCPLLVRAVRFKRSTLARTRERARAARGRDAKVGFRALDAMLHLLLWLLLLLLLLLPDPRALVDI